VSTHTKQTMNKTFNFLILLLFVAFTVNAQETTLYDSQGNARAYIDYDEDATIYLWNGKPVAFLENDGNDMCVFGFNGNFLGWYEDGIMRDDGGNAVGARKGATNMMTNIEPMKSMQEMSPMRPMTSITPIKPLFTNSWSSESLTEFLYSGKN
ncbi:4-fold beta flower protein, partial [Psychroflexus lacisalsi]